MIAPALLFAFLCLTELTSGESRSSETEQETRPIPAASALIVGFERTHQGFSSDEVLCQDELFHQYLKELAQLGYTKGPATAFRELLNLRKAGKLRVPTTRRGKSVPPSVFPIAEIATRVVTDRHRISTDVLLATPALRQELLIEAHKLAPSLDGYFIRKAALQLRKRRSLRPELVLRVANWDRELLTYSLSEVRTKLKSKTIPTSPGIYLFRHAKEGYLYVGEASNLHERLCEHLAGSDRKGLAEFISQNEESTLTLELHVFPPESPASETSVRRAYESELIRSREPKFNVRP